MMPVEKMDDPYGPYFLAARNALYKRLLDVFWEEYQRVFSRPEVKAAERALVRALVKAYEPKADEPPEAGANG